MRTIRGSHVALFVLGGLLALKDEVLLLLQRVLTWSQHLAGPRVAITRYWRHYRETLAPSEGLDAVEALGVLLTGVAVILMLRQAQRRRPHAGRYRDPSA